MSLNFRKEHKDQRTMSTEDLRDMDYLMEEPFDDKVLRLKEGRFEDGGRLGESGKYEWIKGRYEWTDGKRVWVDKKD